MESQAEQTEQTSPKSRLERLREELARTEAALAKKREDRAALAKKIEALENPKLTRKQDAAVKIAKGVAAVEWLKRRPELQSEFDAVLADTCRNNSVRELLGLSPLPKTPRRRRKPDQDSITESEPVTVTAESISITNFPHPPGSKRERDDGGTWLGVSLEEKDKAKEAAINAGGRISWDRREQQWYAPSSMSMKQLEHLAHWLPNDFFELFE